MRIAFVMARYGRSIIGGAETLAHGLAREAVRQGWDVEVWTTCAVDYATWADELPPGISVEDGITVRRFAVDDWNAAKHHALNKRFEQRHGLDTASEYEWVSSGPHSSELNRFIMQNAQDFDAMVTMPYLHSITYDAAWLANVNVVMLPCLHNELKAYMEPYRVMLQSVYGVIFISPEEASFAVDELGLSIKRSAVIGSGVQGEHPSARGSDAQASPASMPYLLYVGRLERGKNVLLLYDFVRRYAEDGARLRGNEIRLVVAGDGPCRPPDLPQFEYLGPVSDAEKNRLYAGALALCQPSFNESFSLVIMESWLAERPVLVWSDCEVTRGHVQRSKGGLWFGNYNQFKAAVTWLLEHEDAADRMGANGRQYVKENFTWEHVFDQFANTLSAWGLAEAE